MTYQEAWNFIVSRRKSLLNCAEAMVQSEWESYCSELLNYKKLFGEIDAQRQVQIGSSERIIPDIILRCNSTDIFDIELKRYNLSFEDGFEKQLISYLNQTHLSVGMIVCNAVHLYSYDYGNRNIEKTIIPFEHDSEDGSRLMELLSRDNFSEDAIKQFITKKNQYKQHVKDISEQVTPTLIEELLTAHFSEQYSADEIAAGLPRISVQKKSVEVEDSFKSSQNYIELRKYNIVESGSNIYDMEMSLKQPCGETGIPMSTKSDVRNRCAPLCTVPSGISHLADLLCDLGEQFPQIMFTPQLDNGEIRKDGVFIWEKDGNGRKKGNNIIEIWDHPKPRNGITYYTLIVQVAALSGCESSLFQFLPEKSNKKRYNFDCIYQGTNRDDDIRNTVIKEVTIYYKENHLPIVDA